jgi:hypothetical protein
MALMVVGNMETNHRNTGMKSLAPGIRGKKRLTIIRLHRLLEFEKSFDKYLRGECTAAYVRNRAKKMLQAGLPRELK